jgi:uncharacterized protein YggE
MSWAHRIEIPKKGATARTVQDSSARRVPRVTPNLQRSSVDRKPICAEPLEAARVRRIAMVIPLSRQRD